MLTTITRISTERTSAESLVSKKFGYWTIGLPLAVLAWACIFVLVEKHPVLALCQNLPLVLLGLIASILANISAIGGGIVGIPVMIFMYHFPPVLALKATLGTQAFGLTAGSISWWRAGFVPERGLRYAVPGLIIGSTISSLVIHADAFLIKSFFGPVSILLGLLALWSLRSGAKQGRDDIPEEAGWPLFVTSILGGLVTGWVSIGEGEIIAALLMLQYGVSAKRSIALGVVLLALNSIYLTMIHLLFLGGIPWHISIFIILGSFFGSRLAPYVAQWLNVRILKIVFANIAIVDGVIFIYQCVQHSSSR
jgi:uncharacterized protein